MTGSRVTFCIFHLAMSVGHSPNRLIPFVVFIALPRVAANMQIFIRGPCEHYPSALVANRGRKTVCRRIKWPRDHPVRSNRNSWTRAIRGVGITSLRGAAQHVNQSGSRICGPRFSLHRVHHPLHAHRVHTHWRRAYLILVSRCANPLI